MQDAHDPFSHLLSEIRAHDAGLRPDWDPHQGDHYLETLLIEEAQEIAWGRRHLTVVHGEILDEFDAELVDELFSDWEDIAASAGWSRIGGVPDDHLTLTLAGLHAMQAMRMATEAALRLKAHHWAVLETAIVTGKPSRRTL